MSTLKNVLTCDSEHPGELLARFMSEAGLSSYELSYQTGLARSRIGLLLRGSRRFQRSDSIAFSQSLEIPSDFFLYAQERFDRAGRASS